METEETFLFVVIILIAAGFIIYFVVEPAFLSLQTESDINAIMSYKFCKSQGYDNYVPSKDYSEHFGKIIYVSCYGRDCEYKEFKEVRK